MTQVSHIPGPCLSLSVGLSIYLPLSACLPACGRSLWRREGCIASQSRSETKTDSREIEREERQLQEQTRDKAEKKERSKKVFEHSKGCFLLSLNHGEVSDPDQDQGERSLAHD